MLTIYPLWEAHPFSHLAVKLSVDYFCFAYHCISFQIFVVKESIIDVSLDIKKVIIFDSCYGMIWLKSCLNARYVIHQFQQWHQCCCAVHLQGFYYCGQGFPCLAWNFLSAATLPIHGIHQGQCCFLKDLNTLSLRVCSRYQSRENSDRKISNLKIQMGYYTAHGTELQTHPMSYRHWYTYV